MVERRTLDVVLAVPGRNAGAPGVPAGAKTVTYAGEPLEVRF